MSKTALVTLEGSSGHGSTSLLSDAENAVNRDQDYFLEIVNFEVEGYAFQVPRYHFAESDGIFATLFTLPQPDAVTKEGSSVDKPIVLEGIKAIDFRALMKVLYPKKVPVEYSLSLSEWISVLDLSTQWDFTEIRTFAISKLEGLSDQVGIVNRLTLGQKHRIRSWFKEGCVSLVHRHSGPTPEEADTIGTNVTVRIYQVREVRLRWHGVFDASTAIEKEFADELGEMETTPNASAGSPSGRV